VIFGTFWSLSKTILVTLDDFSMMRQEFKQRFSVRIKLISSAVEICKIVFATSTS
jgi:hypothetical protein